MSALAIEIDQTLQKLDSTTASRLERLVRDALALVNPENNASRREAGIRFPLVREAMSITGDDVARLQDEV